MSDETKKLEEQRLLKALEACAADGDTVGLAALVEEEHVADLARAFAHLDEDEQDILLELWPNEAVAELLGELAEHYSKDFFKRVESRVAARALEALPADEAADLLDDLEQEVRDTILEAMPSDSAAEIGELLAYPEDTAGGRMSLDFVSVNAELDVATAQRHVRESIGEEQHVHLYLTDEEGRLVGVVFMDRLVSAPPFQKVRELIEPDYHTVPPRMDQEELAGIFQSYDLLAVPVIDESGLMLGEVTVDDILEVLREEATEDIFKMAAISNEELEVKSAFSVVRLRLPWLMVCILGMLLAGAVVDLFSHTLEKIIALATFIPIIIDMAGNAGLQSSTVVVRSLALGRVEPQNIVRSALRELRVGALLGLISGLIVGIIGWLFYGNPLLGLCVGAAMIGAIITSTVAGAFIPLLFNRLGADPAVASGPFITTAADIVGLLIYLGLGTLMFDLLA